MELYQKKCVPCEVGGVPLSKQEIGKLLPEINSEWTLVERETEPARITRVFKFKDFVEAIAFVNNVAGLAESEGHHPDITVHYNRVTIELWTHAVKGLSENDFIVASKIDAL